MKRAAYENTPNHTTYCLSAPHTLSVTHNKSSLIAVKDTICRVVDVIRVSGGTKTQVRPNFDAM